MVTAFGRIGHWFASEAEFGYVPDIITCAKGMTSGYAPMGAMIASDRIMEPFLDGKASFVEIEVETLAQLERLVGRLAGGVGASQGGSLPVPLSGWRGPGVAPVVYASMPMEAATQSTAMAVEVVGRMMANIAQDARLLPPVQLAVKSLEPALKQLVHHDGRFFNFLHILEAEFHRKVGGVFSADDFHELHLIYRRKEV